MNSNLLTGGQFAPARGGQFGPASTGQLIPAKGGQFDRRLQISSLQASRQLGVTQKTAWFLLHRVREMLKNNAPTMLGTEVQIDESYVGGLEKNKHKNKRTKPDTGDVKKRRNIKTPVFGIVQTGGKVIVKVSPYVDKKIAKGLIEKHIEAGSTMVTDGFSMYAYLKNSTEFTHVVVDHKSGQYVNNGFHTNSIENFWSLLKRGIIGIFHQVSPWHLQRYCDEFAARFNSRNIKDHERFDLTLQNSIGRLKYSTLIGK